MVAPIVFHIFSSTRIVFLAWQSSLSRYDLIQLEEQYTVMQLNFLKSPIFVPNIFW